MNPVYTLFLVLFSCAIYAQDNEPILVMNTEMHSAKITSVDSDAMGKYVLTSSHDKTAKLWSVKTGDLIQTYLPPIGKGKAGVLYASAISPDGNFVVMGGFSEIENHSVYIFHSLTGILEHCITGLPNVILDLAFSTNGKYLAASLGGNNGIRIYKTNSWNLYKKDTDYSKRSDALAFANNGNLAAISDDGYIRLYNDDFDLIKKKKCIESDYPISITFSPDNEKIAIGYYDIPKIEVLDASSLTLLYVPELLEAHEYNNHIDILKFSNDGNLLIGGGYYGKIIDGRQIQIIRVWKNQGKGDYKDFLSGQNSVVEIEILKNGNILYATAHPDWGILDINSGDHVLYKESPILDYGKMDDRHLKINKDGTQISCTPSYGNTINFDLKKRAFIYESFMHPHFKNISEQIEIESWNNSYEPTINKELVTCLWEGERSQCVDIAEHEQQIVLGTNWNIIALNSSGDCLWKTPIISGAHAVNITGNNKLIIAYQPNGLICWYRMSDGALLLSLYVHPDRKRWILWTPSGYYDASEGAEELIAWHINQGNNSEALVYPISKFRDQYFRPDVIDQVLLVTDEEKALVLADQKAKKKSISIRSVVDNLPPTVRILSPSTGSLVSNNTIDINYSLKSQKNEPITAIKFLVDGRPVATERGLKPAGKRDTKTIEIPSKNCKISIIAENRFGASPPSSIQIIWSGQADYKSVNLKPNLYILAVGVSDYDITDYDLDYPDDDAEAFTKVFKQQEGLLYETVNTILLTDKKATKDNILDGLDWLIKETTQHDVAMIFFAGHGIEDERGTFFYLPVEADENALRKTCLMEADIQETVAVIAGKIIVFMDACHSGNLMKTSIGRRNIHRNPNIARIVNELIDAENGAVVFSSSTGRQSSLEDDKWGHGAFTKALVEGLEGAAKVKNESKVSCKSLDWYISERVKELTGGRQTPSTNYPPNVPDFPLTIIDY